MKTVKLMFVFSLFCAAAIAQQLDVDGPVKFSFLASGAERLVTVDSAGNLGFRPIGTAGYWEASPLPSNNIYYNIANSNVGIGTDDPKTKLDVHGFGLFRHGLGVNNPSSSFSMSSDSANTSQLLFFNRQNSSPLNLPIGQMAFNNEDRFFGFKADGFAMTYQNAVVLIDPTASNVSDGGGLLRIGQDNAPHLSIDQFNVQARGVGGSTVDDLQLNAYGGDVFVSDTGQTYRVAIGTFDPVEKLTVGGNIALSNLPNDQAIIKNDYNYDHDFDSNLTFGNGSWPWMIGSGEGQDETSGIFGDGDAVTIWAPGDAYGALAPAAFLRIVDEDQWDDNDGNPYNNSALVGYYDGGGLWQTSDQNMKENIESYAAGALDKITNLNAYKYSYKQSSEEVKKGAEPTVAVGVMAQELIQQIPEAVEVTQEGQHFVNHSMITPVLIEAIKEQQAIIDQLTARISALEGKSE